MARTATPHEASTQSGDYRATAGHRRKGIRNLLKSELVLRLRRVTRGLTLGVDLPLQNKVTTTGNRIASPHVELVCIVDLKSEPFHLHWTGKSYPTTGQANRLVRVTDLSSHFLMLNGIGEVLVLGCHDLTMFNPRARANAQGWREHTWKAFESLRKTQEAACGVTSPAHHREDPLLDSSLEWSTPSLTVGHDVHRRGTISRKTTGNRTITTVSLQYSQLPGDGRSLDFVAHVE